MLAQAERNVRVNTLVGTDPTGGLLEHDARGKCLLDRIPLGRCATLRDMAGGAVLLAGDASAFMTGQAL